MAAFIFRGPVAYFYNRVLFRFFLRDIRDRIITGMLRSIGARGVGADVGCGTGRLTPILLSFFDNLLAIDVHKSGLLEIKSEYNNGRVQVIAADICHLPLRNRSVDQVVCASVLEHIKELDRAVENIRKCLEVEGKLVIGYPYETTLIRTLWRFFVPKSIVREPGALSNEEFFKSPMTHKQSYLSIMSLVMRKFNLLHRKKIPPLLSAYVIDCYKSLREE